MSVAFRRESDDEHQEPKFDRPIPAGPNLVTARGLARINEQVTTLEQAVTTETEEVRLAHLKRDLRYWRTRLATAQLAPTPPADEVVFGSRVTFRLNGALRRVDIVGVDEAETAGDRLAFSSPLARALIGTGIGERVDFGDRAGAIEIVDIAAAGED